MTGDEKACATCQHFTQLYAAGGGAGDGCAMPYGKCGLGITDGEWRWGDDKVDADFLCNKWDGREMKRKKCVFCEDGESLRMFLDMMKRIAEEGNWSVRSDSCGLMSGLINAVLDMLGGDQDDETV